MSGPLDGLVLRPVDLTDAAELARTYARNADHLAPWEPERDADFATTEVQSRIISDHLLAEAQGRQRWWALLDGSRIVARISLTNIVRGAMQSGNVGYFVDHEYTGRGIAGALVGEVVDVAVDLGLHRLEASIIPGNEPSRRVLERTGFTRYGHAEKLLHLAGRWTDCDLYQRILHD